MKVEGAGLMLSIKAKPLVAFVSILLLASTAFGERDSNREESDKYVSHRGFKGKIIEVKHRDPEAIAKVVRTLGSGFQGAVVSPSKEFKVIVVRDFPENIAAIEEAVTRFDVPEAPRTEIEFEMHALVASKAESGSSQYPAEIDDLIKKVQSRFNYKSYRHLAHIVQMVKEGRYVKGAGTVEVWAPAARDAISAPYEFSVDSISIIDGSSDPAEIELEDFRFELGQSKGALGETKIRTSIGMREGDKIIIGAANLRDKAVILVLSVRIRK